MASGRRILAAALLCTAGAALVPAPRALAQQSEADASPLNPAAIAQALSEPQFLDAFKSALRDAGGPAAPFGAAHRHIFQELDTVTQSRGVYSRIIVMMNGTDTQNGVEVFVYRDSDVAARHLANLVVTPESMTADGRWRNQSFEAKPRLPGAEPRFAVTCGHVLESHIAEIRQLRCAYHPPGSQIAIATYAYGERPLDSADLSTLLFASTDILGIAQMLARRFEMDAKQASAPRLAAAEQPALVRDLLSTNFHGDLVNVIEELHALFAAQEMSLSPFVKPSTAELIPPAEREERAGLIARIRFSMADPPLEVGVELLIYATAAAANKHVTETDGWPDGRLPPDTQFIGQETVVQFEDGSVTVTCLLPLFDAEADSAFEMRCPYSLPGSRIAAVAYYIPPEDADGSASIRESELRAAAIVTHDALLAAFNYERPATGPVAHADCDAIVGQWSWFIGGLVSFEADGRALWKASPEAAQGRGADWRCDPATGAYTVTWEQGIVDTLRLSSDGQGLDGTNQHDVAVSGARFDPTKAPNEEADTATKVDPLLVGTWRLEIWIPTPQGPIPVTWHIRADGSYEIDAAHLSHTGTMTAKDGAWSLTSQTSDWKDGGHYEMTEWTSVVIHGVLGPGRWHRHEPRLRLETADLNNDKVPQNVPALTVGARQLARHWRNDAVPISVDLDHADNKKRKPVIKLRFYSPTSGGGLVITASPEGSSFFEHSAVNWGEAAIPDGFLDLTEAWAIARQHGLPPPLGRAGLRIWEPEGVGPILAWTLSSQRGGAEGIAIDAANGTVFEGDLTGYVAAYNEMWAQASEGLRRLFARPAPRPSYDFGSDYSCCSSDGYSDSGSDSGSSSGQDTALQNAWGAGDMDAYNRILNGESSWSDSSRYGN